MDERKYDYMFKAKLFVPLCNGTKKHLATAYFKTLADAEKFISFEIAKRTYCDGVVEMEKLYYY